MTDDGWRIPQESRDAWGALDELAPEPLSEAASHRIERALTPALTALSSRGGYFMDTRRAVVAALVLAAAGGAAGFGLGAARAQGTAAAPAADGRQYLLLVHDNEAVDRAVRERGLEAVVERYATWARGLAEEGRLVRAEHLAPTPQWVGEAASASSSIGGFFLIRAASRDEALDIARGSPHAELGGVVEVREVEGGGG